MRITGGIYRGRKIICPRGIIRPAMDKMRESLFSILGDISDYSFLDLFSGSGIIGIEAASRGANPVVLVEKDAIKIPSIKRNIFFIESLIKVYIKSAEKYLKTNKNSYDLIFIDPPFKFKTKADILNLIVEKETLNKEGRIIIHISKQESFPHKVKTLICYDKRRYGDSVLCFFGFEQPKI